VSEIEAALPSVSSPHRKRSQSFLRWLWHGRGRRRPWLRRVIVVSLAITLVLPILLIALFRILPVPGTPLMLTTLISDGSVSYDWVPLNRISANAVKAVIASEDGKFCSHYGFDFAAIEEAMEENARGGPLRGASTISQQTAKNLFLPPTRAWVRKGMEAYYTVFLEALWPKWRIMETYLNVAEFGPGVFGVEAAARRYYGKPASRLTVTEAARLAAVLPSPRNYRVVNPGPYVQRRTGQIARYARDVTRDRLDACVTKYN
jgi:monofunctional biosynthetic peptidoglycan transglycosylase